MHVMIVSPVVSLFSVILFDLLLLSLGRFMGCISTFQMVIRCLSCFKVVKLGFWVVFQLFLNRRHVQSAKGATLLSEFIEIIFF